MGVTDQARYDIRFDWGLSGLAALGECRTFVIVDVLSFSTCVSLVVERDATVLPFHFNDATGAQAFAAEQGALLASRRGEQGRYSLSPASLTDIPAGTRLVLPSPNGSALSVAASRKGCVLAGCFRNRAAVAKVANARAAPIAVIAAGECWADGSLRPCFEDLCGAGSIIAALRGVRSPEAELALAAFSAAESQLGSLLAECVSGRELGERGFSADLRLAAELDVSGAAPELQHGAFSLVR